MTTYTEEEQERICQVKGNHQKEVKGGDSTAIDSIRKRAIVERMPWAEPGHEGSPDLQMWAHLGSSCPGTTGLALCRKMRHTAEMSRRIKCNFRVPNSLWVTVFEAQDRDLELLVLCFLCWRAALFWRQFLVCAALIAHSHYLRIVNTSAEHTDLGNSHCPELHQQGRSPEQLPRRGGWTNS